METATSTLKQSTEPRPDQSEVNGNCLGVERPIRLMLGGRDQKVEGWTNIDLYDGPNVDVKCDVAKLPFEDGVVDEIYASHILEHFSHWKTLDVLKEWHRVLKKGSKAYIGVPDFTAMLNIYKECGMVPWFTRMMYGDQEYPLAYHYCAFDFEHLANLLHDAGFKLVNKVTAFPLGLKDCSTHTDSIYHRPVSLNVEATA